MGRLIFVGLGLGARGISIEGTMAIKSSDLAYLEYYTTPHEPTMLSDLQAATEKELILVDRGMVEDGRKILDDAKSRDVVLAVPGDPLIATTHGELLVRAIKQGTEVKVLHSASIASAAASSSGLHYYKFGRTVTITRETLESLQQAYQIVHRNLQTGLHTLLLLEFDVGTNSGVDPTIALMGLLNAESNFKRKVISDATLALVLSRIGRKDDAGVAGTFQELKNRDYGEHPHCIVIPGSLHFTEAEAIEAIFHLEQDEVRDNSADVKRTAQVLVPRYIEKTERALASVRGRLGEEYSPLLSNVELYLGDAKKFLDSGEDELAMLNIGYAEGLLDALGFTDKVKIDW